MNTRFVCLLPRLLLLGALACLSSCASSGAVLGGHPPTRPDWVDGLHESVGDIEALEPNSGPPLSPTELGHTGSRGVPQDLSRRLGMSAADGVGRPVPASARTTTETQPPEQRQEQRQQMDINVVLPSQLEEEEQFEQEPVVVSALESLYAGQYSESISREIRQFGYDYFSRTQEITEPLEEEDQGPQPYLDDYQVGSGDEIIVSVTGTHTLQERVVVSRDGTLAVSEIPPVAAVGRSLAELRDDLQAAFEATRVGVNVQVGLGRTRLVHIHVVGNVVEPGPKLMPSPVSLLDALTAAGGPDKSGSLRQVVVKRSSGMTETVDLYDLLLFGEQPSIAPLQAGDIVSVPTIGATVGIAGVVQRPAIFEVELPITIAQLLELAGGTTPFSFTDRLQVERTTAGRGREIVDIAFDAAGLEFELKGGDVVLVGAIDGSMRSLVRIEGEVVRPGDFQYRDGMRLADLIRLADGLKISAAPSQVIISRQVGPENDIELLPGSKKAKTSRRLIVADVARALAGDPDENHLLRPLDHVSVQDRTRTSVVPTVEIIGAVQRPGVYELTGDLHVSDLVAIAGNLVPNAFVEEAEVVRNVYDKDTRQLGVKRLRIDLGAALERNPGADPMLVHGDRVVIRRLKESFVTVEVHGEVRFPGTYVFPSDARITDLIAAAGGLLKRADVRASRFTRSSVRDLQRRRFIQLSEHLREQAESSYTRMVQVGTPQEGIAARIALDHTRELIGRMASYQPDGRIIIPWTFEEFPSSAYNLALEDGDRLDIAKEHHTVSVIGHVFNSGAFVVDKGLNVQTLIDRCGGVTDQGDLARIYVIRADGTVQLVEERKKSRRGMVSIYPGDVVMVPRQKLERTMTARIGDALRMMRSGAESALLLNNLDQVDLGVNWVTGSNGSYDLGNVTDLLD